MVSFPAEVEAAIAAVLPSDDPLDSPSFSGSSCVEAGWSQLGGHRRLQWSQTSLIDKQKVGVLYIVIVMILTPE